MYIGTTEAAKILKISTSAMRYLISSGRVNGAYKAGRNWIIPLFNGMPIISKGKRGPKPKWRRVIPAKTKIHVNRNNIRDNKDKTIEELIAVLSVKNTNTNTYGYSLKINGPCEIIYRPQKPLDCKATLWIETFSQVNVRLTNPNKKPESLSEKKSNSKLIGEHSFIVNAA
ncbi:MAG: helix-turn-helix domain-containing protein [Cyanobacteria bacterium P01_A01_bin.68]